MLTFAAIAMTGSVMVADAGDVRRDERIDRAAASIVAERMGGLRGGLEPGFRPVVVELPRAPRRLPRAQGERIPGVWQNGLAIAIEKKTTVSPEL